MKKRLFVFLFLLGWAVEGLADITCNIKPILLEYNIERDAKRAIDARWVRLRWATLNLSTAKVELKLHVNPGLSPNFNICIEGWVTANCRLKHVNVDLCGNLWSAILDLITLGLLDSSFNDDVERAVGDFCKGFDKRN